MFPKVLPKSPKQERGQIQVRTLTSKGKKTFLKNIKYRNKHLLSQAVIFCLGGYYASNSTTRFSTGHFWANVFRQKVTYLSTTMKTAWICTCEMMLLKCLFSALYYLNTLSFIIPPNSVLRFYLYSVCTQSAALWHICALYLVKPKCNINIWSRQTYCNMFCFCLFFNIPLLLWHWAFLMWQPALFCYLTH